MSEKWLYVPASAVRFILDNAELHDCGPPGEGWPSDQMKAAVDTLRGIVGWPKGYSGGHPEGYEDDEP